MIRRARYLSILPFALFATNDARAKDLESFHAYALEKPVVGATAPAGARGFVASVDDKRNTPTFFFARNNQPVPQNLVGATRERLALHHLREHADMYGLSAKALQAARIVMTHAPAGGGQIVVFRQYVGGVEVLDSDMKILMDRQGKLVAIGGALQPSAIAGAEKKLGAFALNSSAAVGKALEDLYGVKLSTSSFQQEKEQKAGYDIITLRAPIKTGTSTHAFVVPARAKKVYFPMPGTVVPAYYVEVQATSEGGDTPDAYAYVIGAKDGQLLRRVSLTEYDAYQYRVWADATAPHTPLDGPYADYMPHPTGLPDNTVPQYVSPIMVTMEGFNKNPMGMVDPWLAAGATETKGNNVDAYTDHTDCTVTGACTATIAAMNDGFTTGVDLRADVTAPGVFDRTYDTAASPLVSSDQSKAAVTQLFYVNNWLHDYWYNSGFTEATGNAQESNFGRGGEEADSLNAQAQDKAIGYMPGNVGAARNNANMSTPRDGEHPRMQMFLWSGQNDLNLDIGAPINASYAAGSAGFGPANFDITGELVLANDNTIETPNPTPGTFTDGCSPLVNNVTGKIVLVDRGYCSFVIKAANVQAAGGIGMLVANNTGTAVVSMGGAGATLPPSLSTTLANGNALKAALQNGPLTVHMKRVSGVEHDGTIDNAIIAHEWGHYLHHRLVNTGSNQGRSQSEGWGDFVAIHMGSRDGDDFATGTFAAAQYSTVSFPDEIYYGIRRLPYTRDMTKNPLTFRHIADENPLPMIPLGSGGANNAEVHNAGEIWTAMLWDAYTKLILSGKYSFDQAKQKMADYLVGGMLMTPTDATFSEQRDAILAYVASVDNDDMLLMAGEFARRGLGTCAKSPDRYSTNHNGLIESFVNSGKQEIVSVKLDDSVLSCDADGILDGGETGKLTVEVLNNGSVPLTNSTVTVTTSTPGVIFNGSNTATIASLNGYSKTTVTFDVGLAAGQIAPTKINLDVDVHNAAGCTAHVTLKADNRIDVDDVVSISKTDNVDSEKSTWTSTGDGASDIWARAKEADGNYLWNGIDYPTQSDTALESPNFNVSAAGSFIVTFDHRYAFETSGTTNYDGGVLEVTTDNGATWADVSTYVMPGYTGAITTTSDNPIGGRQAFVNKSAGFPTMATKTLDFGNALAGKTVKLRFRIATDSGTGASGWEIDNIVVQGVDNTPFSGIIDDAGICNGVPFAVAGPDQTVDELTTVQLDASKSIDPDADPLTYAWTQTAGPTVMLSSTTAANPTFVAPDVDVPTIVSLDVSVTDGKGSAGDSVDIVVMPIPVMGTGGGAGMGGAAGMGGMGGSGGNMGGMGGSGGSTGGAGGAGVGGAGGAAGMGGMGGTGGMGGAAGMGGMGGASSSSSSSTSSSSSSSSSSGETGGSGGGTTTPAGGCDCTVAADSSAPVRSSMFGSLGLLLGLLLRRNRRSSKN